MWRLHKLVEHSPQWLLFVVLDWLWGCGTLDGCARDFIPCNGGAYEGDLHAFAVTREAEGYVYLSPPVLSSEDSIGGENEAELGEYHVVWIRIPRSAAIEYDWILFCCTLQDNF